MHHSCAQDPQMLPSPHAGHGDTRANDEHLGDIKVPHEPRESGLGDPPNTSLGHGLVLVTLASSLRVLLR